MNKVVVGQYALSVLIAFAKHMEDAKDQEVRTKAREALKEWDKHRGKGPILVRHYVNSALVKADQ